MKSLYFTDVKSFIADRTYEIKSFGYKNTKKIQDNIASLKCDIAYLHNCTKGTIQEQTQKVILSIICANLLINIVFFILTFVLKG